MRPTLNQVWVTLPVFLLKVGCGMFLGFPSVLLPALQAPGADIPLDLHQASWFASTTGLVGIVGALSGAYGMQRFGRRRTFLVFCIPSVVGVVVTYYACDVTGLVAGRALHAITMGSNVMVGVVLVGECAAPRRRAVLLNLTTASVNIGSLLVHTLGLYVSWRMLALCTAVPVILSFVLAIFCPESPSWLAERKQYERSREVFYWLRGRTEDSTREIERLINSQRDEKICRTVLENVSYFLRKFKKKNFWKPLVVMCIAIVLSESGGRHAFPAYAAPVLARAAPGALLGAAVDGAIALSSLAAAALALHLRVRTLLFTSGLVAVPALALASLLLYLLNHQFVPQEYSYASSVSLFVFFISSNLGCTCIPISLKGEILPLEHKAVALLMVRILTKLISAVALKLIPHMMVALEVYGYFAITAGMMAASLLGLYLTLPETKHRTLQELDEYFTSGGFEAELPRDRRAAHGLRAGAGAALRGVRTD